MEVKVGKVWGNHLRVAESDPIGSIVVRFPVYIEHHIS